MPLAIGAFWGNVAQSKGAIIMLLKRNSLVVRLLCLLPIHWISIQSARVENDTTSFVRVF